jgi:hypothetical protein
VRSPKLRLRANSTLSAFVRYVTEDPNPNPPNNGPWDRANVGLFGVESETRTTVVPDGGQLYEITTQTRNGACVLANQRGWAAVAPGSPGYPNFNQSTWTQAALNPGGAFTGQRTQIEFAYSTDELVADDGFDFDHVTLTNFDLQVPDAQACVAPQPARPKPTRGLPARKAAPTRRAR